MPKRKATCAKKKSLYQVEAYYPISQYPNREKETLIGKLARESHGTREGSGMGFGKRDLGFTFKNRADASRFIGKLKTRRISRSGIHDWSKY